MEGGDLAAVEEPEFVPDPPYEVSRFRSIVNSIKRVLIRELEEEDGASNIQDLTRMNGTEQKLKRLAVFLRDILRGSGEHADAQRLIPYFQAAGLDLPALPTELRDLCLHFVDVDIGMYPWDLSPVHIDAVQKSPF
jgi:hypothetical protein